MEQESRKTIGIMVECAKMTPEIFRKVIEEMAENIHKPPTGKTSVRKMMKQGKVDSIALNENLVGDFARTARKHGLTYAVKRIEDNDGNRKYLVMFNGKNTDVMKQAFDEFTKQKTRSREAMFSREKIRKMEVQEKPPEQKNERERKKTHKPQSHEL